MGFLLGIRCRISFEHQRKISRVQPPITVGVPKAYRAKQASYALVGPNGEDNDASCFV